MKQRKIQGLNNQRNIILRTETGEELIKQGHKRRNSDKQMKKSTEKPKSERNVTDIN